MRTIFLADAHLALPGDENYRLLLAFLNELRGTTETLFIMGDLFDFWLGFPAHPFRQYDPLLDALLELTRSGCRLVYFEGNHDFHLGSIFSERLGAEIHTGPAVVTIQGRRLYLCHGDQINRADRGYRFLRLMLHNPITAWAVRHFPPFLALKIKERLQRASQAGYRSKALRWDYPDIIRNFASSVRHMGCEGLITGHFHLELCEQLEGQPLFTILALGDWMERFTYGEIVDGQLYLKRYSPHP